MRSDLGLRKPAHCTAEGQAILAFRPSDVSAVVRKGKHLQAVSGPPWAGGAGGL